MRIPVRGDDLRGWRLTGWLIGLSALVLGLVLSLITLTGIADVPGWISAVLLMIGLLLNIFTGPVVPRPSSRPQD